MALMKWSDMLSVKVARFDKEHQNLIDIINDLHEAMMVGKGKEVVASILKRLMDYTSTHFKSEELVLSQYGYPDLAQQKAEHKKFINQLSDIQKQLLENKAFPTTILCFLRDWLNNHIMKEDKKYGSYLNGKGLS